MIDARSASLVWPIACSRAAALTGLVDWHDLHRLALLVSAWQAASLKVDLCWGAIGKRLMQASLVIHC